MVGSDSDSDWIFAADSYLIRELTGPTQQNFLWTDILRLIRLLMGLVTSYILKFSTEKSLLERSNTV